MGLPLIARLSMGAAASPVGGLGDEPGRAGERADHIGSRLRPQRSSRGRESRLGLPRLAAWLGQIAC